MRRRDMGKKEPKQTKALGLIVQQIHAGDKPEHTRELLLAHRFARLKAPICVEWAETWAPQMHRPFISRQDAAGHSPEFAFRLSVARQL